MLRGMGFYIVLKSWFVNTEANLAIERGCEEHGGQAIPQNYHLYETEKILFHHQIGAEGA